MALVRNEFPRTISGSIAANSSNASVLPSESDVYRPFLSDYAETKGRVIYAQFGRPVFQALSCASVLNHHDAGTIAMLLFPRRPSAVLWRVVSIVVDALKLMSIWRITHIFEKSGKSVPLRTVFYPAPTVSVKGWIAWICASAAHVAPRRICGRMAVFHNVPRSMRHVRSFVGVE